MKATNKSMYKFMEQEQQQEPKRDGDVPHFPSNSREELANQVTVLPTYYHNALGPLLTSTLSTSHQPQL
jgi:hypothetical protein